MNKIILLTISVLIISTLYVVYTRSTNNSTGASLTLNELIQIQKEIDNKNKPPNNEKVDPKIYPQSLGIDPRNNKSIKIGYSCGDLCPMYAELYMYYEGITEFECAVIGGKRVGGGFKREKEYGYCAPNLEKK